MDADRRKFLALFGSQYLDKLDALEAGQFKFVHYTSADAAMRIISSREVWMRNAQCMNDYLEVEHGHDCLVQAYHSEPEGQQFRGVIDAVDRSLRKEIEDLFDGWMPHLRHSVYIACLSEHPSEEKKYGRLSMWRAYGGAQPVALVMNGTPFLSGTGSLGVFSAPAMYMESDEFRAEFRKLTARLERARPTLELLGREGFKNILFEIFKRYVLCLKHPGFSEEREWRVYYTPALNVSEHIESEIVSINGVPQEVHKVPLRDIPEIDFCGAAIPDFLDSIIIGPSDQQLVMGRTFEKLLADAGCEEVENKVHYSGIPLR